MAESKHADDNIVRKVLQKLLHNTGRDAPFSEAFVTLVENLDLVQNGHAGIYCRATVGSERECRRRCASLPNQKILAGKLIALWDVARDKRSFDLREDLKYIAPGFFCHHHGTQANLDQLVEHCVPIIETWNAVYNLVETTATDIQLSTVAQPSLVVSSIPIATSNDAISSDALCAAVLEMAQVVQAPYEAPIPIIQRALQTAEHILTAAGKSDPSPVLRQAAAKVQHGSSDLQLNAEERNAFLEMLRLAHEHYQRQYGTGDG